MSREAMENERAPEVAITIDVPSPRAADVPSPRKSALKQQSGVPPVSPKTRFGRENEMVKRKTSFGYDSKSSSPRTSFSQAGVGADGKRSSEAYVLFRTRSTKIERQLTRFREQEQKENAVENESLPADDSHSDECCENNEVPAGRFFDALQGPELEQLRDSEEILLPTDQKWPFLLRFPITTFGITLGLGSQAILWKNLNTVPAVSFLKIPEFFNDALWLLAALSLLVIFVTYSLKAFYYFEAIKREYHHPVRTNFFFAPWIATMFLALGIPPSFKVVLHPAVCILLVPMSALELKIYGQWLSGGERRLSKVANPSTHLSVVGNFVGALVAASAGWKDLGIFFWGIGFAHYLVLFVTLYQRLPTNETLPKELHPVFFLFIAAPSAASIAWEKINGEFGSLSKLVFFIALFLFSSLVVRVNFFRGIKFSIAWWAYTFPMTALSIASIHYSQETTTTLTKVVAVLLSLASSLTVAMLFIATLLHLFYWETLFPNDMAIAITNVSFKRSKKNRKKKKNTGKGESDGSVNSEKGSEGDAVECHRSGGSLELLSCFGRSRVENFAQI